MHAVLAIAVLFGAHEQRTPSSSSRGGIKAVRYIIQPSTGTGGRYNLRGTDGAHAIRAGGGNDRIIASAATTAC